MEANQINIGDVIPDDKFQNLYGGSVPIGTVVSDDDFQRLSHGSTYYNESPIVKSLKRVYAGALHGATSFNKFIGLGTFKPTRDIFIRPGEKKAEQLRKESPAKSKIGKMTYDFIEGLGSLGVTLPMDVATGAASKLALAEKIIPEVAGALSKLPDFAVGMGIRGTVEGAKEGSKKGIARGLAKGVSKGLEQTAMGLIYGKVGGGLKGIPKMAALGTAGSFYDAAKQGRLPTTDEIEKGTYEGMGYGLLFAVLPVLQRTTQITKERYAINGLRKALRTNNPEVATNGLQKFFDNKNVRPELKNAIKKTLTPGPTDFTVGQIPKFKPKKPAQDLTETPLKTDLPSVEPVTKPSKAAVSAKPTLPPEGTKVASEGEGVARPEEITTDRNSFVVERVSGPETYNRGETVKWWISGNKKDGAAKYVTGKINGISHRKMEAKIDNQWVDFGRIYKTTLKPETKSTKPLSKAVKSINIENAPPSGWKESDKITKQPWKMTTDEYVERKKQSVINQGVDESEIPKDQISMWEREHIDSIANSPRDTDISANVLESLPDMARESLLRTHPKAAANWVDSFEQKDIPEDVLARARTVKQPKESPKPVPATEKPSKEPWKMGIDELKSDQNIRIGDIKAAQKVKKSLINQIEKAIKNQYNSEEEKQNLKANLEKLKKEKMASVILSLKNVKGYQFGSNYDYFSMPHKMEEIRGWHRNQVRQASESGKPVPRHVLEEYKGEKWADDALAKLTEAEKGAGAKAEKPTEAKKQETPNDTLAKYDLYVTKDGKTYTINQKEKWHDKDSNKGTFANKDIIKKIGGVWKSKKWRYNDDPTEKLAETLKIKHEGFKGIAGDRTGGSSKVGGGEPGTTGKIRSTEIGTLKNPGEYVSPDTIKTINKGKEHDIPEKVLTEQIDDTARIVKAKEEGSKMFILANEAGTGKTFVLGAAIQELKRRGSKSILYVTMNRGLIKQIKQDLSGFDIKGVDFTTYSMHRKSKSKPYDVVIYDESQNIKNIGSEVGKNAQKFIEKAKYTIFASATPFSNPIEARYLEPAGAFGVRRWWNWAKDMGATEKKIPGSDKKILIWPSKLEEGGIRARNWFIDRGEMTQRDMQLSKEFADVHIQKVTAEPEHADLYEKVSNALDNKIESLRGGEKGRLAMYAAGLKKRLLEAAKVDEAITIAKNALKRGRRPIIFIETKAERVINARKIVDSYGEWLAMKTRMGRAAGKPPYAKVVYRAAQALLDADIDKLTIEPTQTKIRKALGKDVAIYTGAISDAAARKNLELWRKGKKQILVVTMAKGGTGLSLHDTAGDMPTTQININLPWTASGVAQVSGRSARYGVKSKPETVWLYAENIPFDSSLSDRVSQRMKDMGAVLKGRAPELAGKIEKVPETAKKEPKVSKARTLRGAIKKMGGINFLNYKGELRDLDVFVRKAISRKTGIPIDNAVDDLIADGWLDKNTTVSSFLEDLRAGAKDLLSRDRITRDFSSKKEWEKSKKEKEFEKELNFEHETPPEGKYITLNAEDLPVGKEITLLENKSSRGWDVYKVVEKDPFSITLKDGSTVELKPLDKVEVLKKDLSSEIKQEATEKETLDKDLKQIKESLDIFGQKKPGQQTLFGGTEPAKQKRTRGPNKTKQPRREAQLNLFTGKQENQIQKGLFDTFIKKPKKGIRGATRWVKNSPTGRVFEAPSMTVKNVDEVASILSSIGDRSRETLLTVTVDKNGKILEIYEHSKGTKSSSSFHPIEVAAHVLNIPDADMVYIVHNHPSGDLRNSPEDLDMAIMTSDIVGLRDIKTKAFIIAGDKWKGFSGTSKPEGKITPATGKEKIKVMEGVVRGKLGEIAKNAKQFRKLIKDKYNGEEGIVFFDIHLRDLGFLPWPKGIPIKEATIKILTAAEELNATTYAITLNKPITYGNRLSFIRDFAKTFGKHNLPIVEIMEQGRSYADAGLIRSYQRRSSQSFKKVSKPDLLFSYAGEKARTADNSGLARAVKMKQEGAKNEDIRRKTGWFIGLDNKWRFEINDNKMKTSHLLDTLEETKFDKDVTITLEEAIGHQKLFDAYPELKKVTIRKQSGLFDKFKSSQGWFNEKEDEIVMTPYAKDIKGTILHEIQHWIQQKEGFARGGNVETALEKAGEKQLKKLASKTIDTLKDNLQTISKYMNVPKRYLKVLSSLTPEQGRKVNLLLSDMRKKIGSSDFRKERKIITKKIAKIIGADDSEIAGIIFKMKGGVESGIKEIQKDVSQDAADIAKITNQIAEINFAKNANELRETIKKIGEVNQDVYRNLAGEIESRSVSLRKNLTEAQRKTTPPYPGIPQEDVILTFASPATPESRLLNKDNISKESISDATNKVVSELSSWSQFPATRVHADESSLPKRLRPDVEFYSKKAGRRIEGIYDPKTDTVHLINSNITKDRLISVLKHEAIGHRGLRLYFGDDLNKSFLDPLAEAKKDELLSNNPDLNWKDKEAVRLATDEWVADKLEQDHLPITWHKRLIRAFKQWLRKFIPNLKMTDKEIRTTLSEIARNVREGGRDRMTEKNPDIRFSFADKKEKLKEEIIDNKFISRFKKDTRNLIRTFAPTTISKEAKLGATIRRTHLGKATFVRNSFVDSAEKFSSIFDWVKKDKQIEITKAIETGKLGKKDLIEFNKKTRTAIREYEKIRKSFMDSLFKHLTDRELINPESYIENYVSHIWDNPEKAKKVFNEIFQKTPLSGSKYFTKKRFYQLYQDGIEAGLKPKYTNIVDNDIAYVSQALKTISIHDTINELKDLNLWKFVKFGKAAPEGWTKVKDPISRVMFKGTEGVVYSGDYYAPDDIAHILNNEASKGLYGKSLVYDGAREINNAMNMSNLSMSLYHGMFSYLTWGANRGALSASQFMRGDFKSASKNAFKAISLVNIPFFAKDIIRGEYYRKLALNPERAKTASQRMALQALEWANADPKLDRYYALSFAKRFMRDLKQGKAKAIVKAPFALLESIASPIMNHLVPDLKYSAFLDTFKEEMARKNPKTEMEAKQIAGETYRMVEDRFGQMNYDNLMWNRALKDTLMIGVRAVGWNFGDISEVVGAGHNVGKIVKDMIVEGKIPKNSDISNRVYFVMALPMTVALTGAMYMYLRGQKPKDLFDYIAPRTGNKNSDGSDERVVFASYLKDWVAAAHEHPLQMAKNKASPLMNATLELMANQDYWGNEIYGDKNKTGDILKYMSEKWVPFSFSNLIKMKERGATTSEAIQPLLGIIPAPRYLTNTPAQDYIYKKFRETKGKVLKESQPAMEWKRRLKRSFIKTGRVDMDIIKEGISKHYITPRGVKRVTRNLSIPSDIKMFERLPAELQVNVLDKPNKTEYNKYYRASSRRTKILFNERMTLRQARRRLR